MTHFLTFWGDLWSRYEAWQHTRLFEHWRNELDQRRGAGPF